MTSGRKSVFTIYDESIFDDFKKYLFFNKIEQSKWIWGNIVKVVSDYRVESQEKENITNFNSTITSFTPASIPPRIIEDFEHIIRPYMNKSTEEEIKLTMDNGYMQYVYGRYCVIAARNNILSHEDRRMRDISYDRALRGLEHIESMTGLGFVRKSRI